MNSSPGLVTVILLVLGKQNASKNLDSFFCYVNKTFNHNFIPELYAQDDTELFYFSPGQTREDSVTQMDGQMTLPEGTALTINCTYSATGYPITFWYVQYPGEGPQVLLKAMKDNEKGTNKEFEATYHKESKSFHLEKASVQDSDSAVYYCALSNTVMGTAGAAEHKLFEWQQGAWRLSVSPFDPLCGTVYGGLSLSLWLIQNSYKFLENKNKK
uniref:Ig-like domain-containing protein n=1 Tax=Phocoena sinus TaxID=42100 RepID=A0A8C9CFV1_PHOSS